MSTEGGMSTEGSMNKMGSWAVTPVLLFWAAGTVLAFWHFEGQYLRPVSRPPGAATSYPERLPPAPETSLATDAGLMRLTGPEPVTLLNFWNPRCPCSRFAESDVQRLIQTYRPAGVRFITVIASGTDPAERQEAASAWRTRDICGTAARVDSGNRIAQRFGVWAAPAAVILDRQGRVAYVGAYNAARYCHDPRTAWASKALAAVIQRQSPPRAKTLFFGCQLLRADR